MIARSDCASCEVASISYVQNLFLYLFVQVPMPETTISEGGVDKVGYTSESVIQTMPRSCHRQKECYSMPRSCHRQKDSMFTRLAVMVQ